MREWGKLDEGVGWEKVVPVGGKAGAKALWWVEARRNWESGR